MVRGSHQVLWPEVRIKVCGQRFESRSVVRGSNQGLWSEVRVMVSDLRLNSGLVMPFNSGFSTDS